MFADSFLDVLVSLLHCEIWDSRMVTETEQHKIPFHFLHSSPNVLYNIYTTVYFIYLAHVVGTSPVVPNSGIQPFQGVNVRSQKNGKTRLVRVKVIFRLS